MQSLIDECVKECPSRRVSPQCLKKAIAKTDRFDFLKDVADKIEEVDEDAQEPKRRRRSVKASKSKESPVQYVILLQLRVFIV